MDRWCDLNYIVVVIFMGQLCSPFLRCLDSIKHMGLRLALNALRTSPVESVYFEANEALLNLRREKLALQYYKHLQPCPPNPTFECTIIPQYKYFLLERSRTFQLKVLEFNQYMMTVIL